jgi:hypothetical protein
MNHKFELKTNLLAAEIIAFKVLNPALRSRGKPSTSAQMICEQREFKAEIIALFAGRPAGTYMPKNLDNLSAIVIELSKRLDKLEKDREG